MAGFQPTPRTPDSVLSGFRGPENIVSQNVIADVSDTLHEYAPKKTPLLTLTSRMKDKRKATQRRVDWIEADEYPRELVLTGAALVADNSLDVAAGDEARAAAGYIYMNTRTREHVRVTSTSSTVVNVTRAVDGGNEVDMAANDTLVFLRYVAEDGADIGTSKTTVDTDKFNYCEIIRSEFSLTGRDIEQSLYTGRDLPTTRRRKAVEHAKSIESAMYFGKRASISGSSHLVTFMGGLEYFITSNIWDLSGVNSINERDFDEFLEEALRWGDGGYRNAGTATKYLIAGSKIVTEIDSWAKQKLQYRPLDETIGFGAMEYLTAFGRVRIIHSPILDYNHSGWGFLLDLNHVHYVYHQGRDTRLLDNRQGNGIDGISEEYMTDCSLMVELEGSHSVIKRFKEAA